MKQTSSNIYSQPTGTINRLIRYPVKSLLGEDIDITRITERGVTGDRAFALLDQDTGLVATAKNPRRWRHLLKLQSALISDSDPLQVKITLPDGSSRMSRDPDIHSWLSQAVGREVKLESNLRGPKQFESADSIAVLEHGVDADAPVSRGTLATGAPDGTFFDYAPLHLLTTATLEALARHNDTPIEAERYRPNLVIETPSLQGFAENEWVGKTVRIGETLKLRIMQPTARCAVPTLEHGDLERKTGALLVPAEHNNVPAGRPRPSVGVYAQVIRPGDVRVGDAVVIE